VYLLDVVDLPDGAMPPPKVSKILSVDILLLFLSRNYLVPVILYISIGYSVFSVRPFY